MISDIKTEIILLIRNNITSVNNRVYPLFTNTIREGDENFIALDGSIVSQEKLLENKFKHIGIIRFMAVDCTVLKVDNLIDSIEKLLESNSGNFKSFYYGMVTDSSLAKPFMDTKPDLVRKTFDVGVIWFE